MQVVMKGDISTFVAQEWVKEKVYVSLLYVHKKWEKNKILRLFLSESERYQGYLNNN